MTASRQKSEFMTCAVIEPPAPTFDSALANQPGPFEGET
jgi:hypothetical protein